MIIHHIKKFKPYKRHIQAVSAVIIIIFAGIGVHFLFNTHAAAPSSAPSSGTPVCGQSILQSPYSSTNDPALGTTTNVVTIPAGTDSGNYNASNTTYYFAPGTHHLPSGQYDQIVAGSNDWYVGQYSAGTGATLDGQSNHNYGFTGGSGDTATIEYLTVQNFNPDGAGYAIGSGSGITGAPAGWTIKYDTVQDNYPGSGVNAGSNSDVEYNCLTNNGDYGLNSYSTYDTSSLTSGPSNVTVNNNEISYNNQCNWEAISSPTWSVPANCTDETNTNSSAGNGCGCAGGAHFWNVDGSTFENNYVHDNYDAGSWWDTNNNGETIEGNYYDHNFGEATMIEISYNALIEDNSYIDNAWGGGILNPGFPTGAIYISESGGEGRVTGNANGIDTLTISGNNFTNNWDGVVLWENRNRFCGTLNNSSSGDCTLIPPSSIYYVNNTNKGSGCGQVNLTGATPSGSPDYYDNCRWKTQNVSVTDNNFTFTTASIPNCNPNNNVCGENGLFSDSGAPSPSWSPYTGDSVENAITQTQNNHFANNTYVGPWTFMYANQGNTYDFASWQSDGQDLNSTYNGSGPTLPSTPTGLSVTSNTASAVSLAWTASTDTGGPGLAGYYVFRDGNKLNNTAIVNAHYTDSSVSPSTSYTYSVEAVDNSGDVSAQSSSVPDTTPANSGTTPTTTITNVSNNAQLHGTSSSIDATATANDGGSITSVKLLVDSSVVQTITSSPYDFSLNTLNYAFGSHTIQVQATDDQGNVGTTSITIYVTNGDLNGDGVVNIEDLSIMAANWGTGNTYAKGDINGQGPTSVEDLAILASNWGDQVP